VVGIAFNATVIPQEQGSIRRKSSAEMSTCVSRVNAASTRSAE
jgi:hypothetical protein